MKYAAGVGMYVDGTVLGFVVIRVGQPRQL